jgi:hypothetical protein
MMITGEETVMSDRVGHVSATSIQTYKTCPMKYRIGYVEGIRQTPEPEPFRMGTAWHKGLEVLSAEVGTFVNELDVDSDSTLRITEDNRLEIAVELATAVYAEVPDYADPTAWAVEREVIANSLAAYAWFYGSASEYETVATELSFELPLVNPETGHSTPNFKRVGKIDRIVRHKGSGQLLIQENKSTSKSIDSGSTYWQRLRKDTQSKFYIQAARDLQESNSIEAVAPGALDQLVSGLLHDVWRKPAIRPSKLTMAESAEFVKTGDYCGQTFAVDEQTQEDRNDTFTLSVSVDGVKAELEPGKKEGTFALRETPGMYGARLFQDMTITDADHKGPAWYFARREIAFTDQELKAFEYQIWALQKNMNEMERTGFWFENETQCEATFKCCYCNLCYNNVDVFNGQTPPGFKRLRAEAVEQVETGEAE